jgi:hypothetical protein
VRSEGKSSVSSTPQVSSEGPPKLIRRAIYNRNRKGLKTVGTDIITLLQKEKCPVSLWCCKCNVWELLPHAQAKTKHQALLQHPICPHDESRFSLLEGGSSGKESSSSSSSKVAWVSL